MREYSAFPSDVNTEIKSSPAYPKDSGEESPDPAVSRPQRLKKRQFITMRDLRPHISLAASTGLQGSRITAREIFDSFNRCYSCGSMLELRQSVDSETGECGRIRLHAANFCTQPVICEVCAGRVGDRRQARFAEAIKTAADSFPGAYLVTFTIPDGESLVERFGALRASMRAFQRLGQRGRSGEWSKVRAGLSKIEIKRGKGSGLWHAHCHALLFTDGLWDYRQDREIEFRGRMVSASKLSAEWNRASGGEAMGIRVDPLAITIEHKARGLSKGESVLLQAREVLKYITKFNVEEYNGDRLAMARDFVEVKKATYCRRLFSTFGIFRAVPGNDYVSDGPWVYQNPNIYSSAWGSDSRRYSPLRLESRPMFNGLEKGSQFENDMRERITALNRYGGQIRRARSAIFKARDTFIQTGNLEPARYELKTWDSEGNESVTPALLELPGYVLADPASPEPWERWVNDFLTAGRHGRASLRGLLIMEFHDGDRGPDRGWFSHFSQSGRSINTSELVVNSFLRILKDLHGPPDSRGWPNRLPCELSRRAGVPR